MAEINTYILRELVTRVRAECPTLERRCGPASDYTQELFENTSIPVPNCTIIPLIESSYEKQGVFQQETKQSYGFIVAIDNKPRRLDGQDLQPYDVLKQIKSELDAALLQWIPAAQDFMIDEMLRSKGVLLKQTESRIWYQYEYSTKTYVYGVSARGQCADPVAEGDIDTIYYTYLQQGHDGETPPDEYDILATRP